MIEVVIVNEAETEVHFDVDLTVSEKGVAWQVRRQGSSTVMGVLHDHVKRMTNSKGFGAVLARKLGVHDEERPHVIDLCEVMKDGTLYRKIQNGDRYFFVHAYGGEA